jgi:hypothetical protein
MQSHPEEMSELMPLDPAEVQAIDAQASVLMKEGLRLLEDADRESVTRRAILFDRALALRSGARGRAAEVAGVEQPFSVRRSVVIKNDRCS